MEPLLINTRTSNVLGRPLTEQRFTAVERGVRALWSTNGINFDRPFQYYWVDPTPYRYHLASMGGNVDRIRGLREMIINQTEAVYYMNWLGRRRVPFFPDHVVPITCVNKLWYDHKVQTQTNGESCCVGMARRTINTFHARNQYIMVAEIMEGEHCQQLICVTAQTTGETHPAWRAMIRDANNRLISNTISWSPYSPRQAIYLLGYVLNDLAGPLDRLWELLRRAYENTGLTGQRPPTLPIPIEVRGRWAREPEQRTVAGEAERQTVVGFGREQNYS